MDTGRWIPPVIVGDCRFHSGVFSNRWTLSHGGTTMAELRRDPSRHTSSGEFADGTRFQLTPDGWGTVLMEAQGRQLGRIDRRSWWGRRWEIGGTGFGSDLTSDPMPRRWTLRIGGEPIGYLAGTLWSYNRLTAHTDVSVPVHALVLAWHVLARPWEAAAAPRSLVPDTATTS
ncbi:MAG: hypothetical protein V3V29_06275 [Acidimicrobiia bacterium]